MTLWAATRCRRGEMSDKGGCQTNLEVGDPLTGHQHSHVTMPNGYGYHLQELRSSRGSMGAFRWE